jgi:hypothetical protein
MSQFTQLTAIDEQLVTDLTATEGENASGGYGFYTLGNKSGIGVNYTINGRQEYLKPYEEKSFFFFYDPTVAFDRKIGPGYEPSYQTLSSKRQNFDRTGDYLLLTGGAGTPNANLT